MRLVTCSPDHPEVSKFGSFRLVPEAGWRMGRSFIDFSSGLLIVGVSNPASERTVSGMTFAERFVHVFVIESGDELTPEEWSHYFDYSETNTRSPDGRFNLLSQRVLGENGKGDRIEEELVEVATGTSRATSKGDAFRAKERLTLLDSFLQREKSDKESQAKLESDVRQGVAQRCPRCDTPVHRNARYPDHLCRECASLDKADESGRPVSFSNVSFSGGFRVNYMSGGDIASHDDSQLECICIIDGERYVATEARFGGIVIRPFPV